jgi:hypothetical protein
MDLYLICYITTFEFLPPLKMHDGKWNIPTDNFILPSYIIVIVLERNGILCLKVFLPLSCRNHFICVLLLVLQMLEMPFPNGD